MPCEVIMLNATGNVISLFSILGGDGKINKMLLNLLECLGASIWQLFFHMWMCETLEHHLHSALNGMRRKS